MKRKSTSQLQTYDFLKTTQALPVEFDHDAHGMDQPDIEIVQQTAREALVVLDDVLGGETSADAWEACFNNRKFEEVELSMFELARDWIAEMLASQGLKAGSKGHGGKDRLRRSATSSLRRSPRDFSFVKVISPLVGGKGQQAWIAPELKAMYFAPYFFEQCGSLDALCPSTGGARFPKAIVFIHELIHYVSYHNFANLTLMTKDRRLRQYIDLEDLDMVEDIELVIDRDAQAGFDTLFQPIPGERRQGQQHDDEGNLLVDCYNHGVFILANTAHGDVGALLNADSYAMYALDTAMEGSRRKLVRRLSMDKRNATVSSTPRRKRSRRLSL